MDEILHPPAPKIKLSCKIAIAAALVAAAAGISVFTVHRKRVSDGYYIRQTIAAETMHHEVTGAMLACFYQQEKEAFHSSEKHFDSSKPLSEQIYEGSTTWYSQIMELAKARITNTLRQCEAASADGFTLSADQQEACKKQAAETDLTDYPTGVNTDDLAQVLILEKTAEAYADTFEKTLSVPREEIDAYMQDHSTEYLTLKMLSYRFSYDAPNDTLTAMRSAAYSAATNLAECHNITSFKDNIANYLSARGESADRIEKIKNALTVSDTANSFPWDIQVWALQNQAAIGDTIIIENQTERYFEVCQMLEAPRLDESKTVDLRIITLLNETYGSAQKALDTADELRKRCGMDQASPEAFAKLAAEYSSDPDSKNAGGLITGYAQSRTQLGESVSKWAFSTQRKQGDMIAVELPDAALLVYFESRNEHCAWESSVWLCLRSEKLRKFNENIDAQTVSFHDTAIDEISE